MKLDLLIKNMKKWVQRKQLHQYSILPVIQMSVLHLKHWGLLIYIAPNTGIDETRQHFKTHSHYYKCLRPLIIWGMISLSQLYHLKCVCILGATSRAGYASTAFENVHQIQGERNTRLAYFTTISLPCPWPPSTPPPKLFIFIFSS